MVEVFRQIFEGVSGTSFGNVSDVVILMMGIVIIALIVVSIFAMFVQIYLSIRYFKYNRKKNSIGKTGQDIARKVLDDNGLENIAVKSSGSILFGNSYSHYFHKVRLRRLTWKKDSVASLAMATQKSCLAIIDKENDPDMRTRVKLTPFIYFGPMLFLPLVVMGILLDVIILKSNSFVFTIGCTAFAAVMYLISFIMNIKVLNTEIKAQKKAYEVLKKDNMATDEELDMLKKLFKLYNIQYINDMIVALLEFIYRVLQIVAYVQQNSNK